MKNCFFAGLIVLSGFAAMARPTQPLDTPAGNFPLRQDGELVSIKIVRGEPLRFFVVGREEAALDLQSLKLTVRRIKPTPGEYFRAQKQGESFIVPEITGLTKTSTIEIKTQIGDKSESLEFNLNPNVP